MSRTPPGRSRERVYRFVRERLLEGRPPTVREVQHALGFRAVESARSHLEALVAARRLDKEPGKSRGYRLPRGRGHPAPTVLVPLLGQVPAGRLDTAVEDVEGYVPARKRRGGARLFALRVRGDSMTGAGILDGDVVLVRRQATAESGDIVVAMVGDEATVKRLRVKGRRIELRPENPAYEPIVPDPRELTLLGKVVELRRYFGGEQP